MRTSRATPRPRAEISEQLEYFPANFKVLQHIRHKYACAKCDGEGYNPHITTAAKPLFTGSDWDFATVQRMHDAIETIALDEMGLKSSQIAPAGMKP